MKTLSSEDNKRTLFVYNILDLCTENCPKNIASCLIQSSNDVDNECIRHIVLSAIEAGVVFFMTWGYQAENLHDLIDDVIESASTDLSHIVTTHHEDEIFEDVAWFFINSTYFGHADCRYLAIFQNDELDKKIKNALLTALNGS